MTEEELRAVEAEKIRAEIEQMRKPPLLRPSMWISIVVAAGGFVSAGVQWVRSGNELVLAEAKRERAELQVEQARAAFEAWTKRAEEAKQKLKAAQEELAAIREQAANVEGLLNRGLEALRQPDRTKPMFDPGTGIDPRSVYDIEGAKAIFRMAKVEQDRAVKKVSEVEAAVQAQQLQLEQYQMPSAAQMPRR